MNEQDGQSAPRYVVVEGDRYASDRDAFGFQLIRIPGPDYADRWLKGLKIVVNGLTDFPGPLSHGRDEEASTAFGREVRRLLYHGPSRRRSKQPCRILFTLTPPSDDEPDGATVIFLLRLLRGGQSLRDMNDEPESPNSL